MDHIEILEKINELLNNNKQTNKRIKLVDAFTNLLNYVEVNCRPDTISFYKAYFKRSTAFFDKYSIIYLDELNMQNTAKIIADLKLKSLSNTSINKYIMLFKYIVKYNYEIGYLDKNILLGLKKLKNDELETPIIPDSVIKQVFKYLETLDCRLMSNLRLNVIVRLLHDTGMRSNELYNLKVMDIDLNANKIRLTFTKSGKPRLVYFTDQTKAYIVNYLKWNKLEYSAYFLVINNHRFSLRGIGKALTNIQTKLNLKCSISPHKWRHTLASNLLKNGMNLKSVQKILGHYNICITSKYLHTFESDDKTQFVNILNKLA